LHLKISLFPSHDRDGSDGYRSDIFLTKFEKEVRGENLSYTFIKAFPTAITSMPVSYGDSDILRCNVSFTYMRYIKQRVRRGGIDFDVNREGPTVAPPASPPGEPTQGVPTQTFIRRGFNIRASGPPSETRGTVFRTP
jgi:hypothetical protein